MSIRHTRLGLAAILLPLAAPATAIACLTLHTFNNQSERLTIAGFQPSAISGNRRLDSQRGDLCTGEIGMVTGSTSVSDSFDGTVTQNITVPMDVLGHWHSTLRFNMLPGAPTFNGQTQTWHFRELLLSPQNPPSDLEPWRLQLFLQNIGSTANDWVLRGTLIKRVNGANQRVNLPQVPATLPTLQGTKIEWDGVYENLELKGRLKVTYLRNSTNVEWTHTVPWTVRPMQQRLGLLDQTNLTVGLSMWLADAGM